VFGLDVISAAAAAALSAATLFGAAPVEVRVAGALGPAGSVRLMVYADAESFLQAPIAKLQASVDEAGVAVFRIADLPPGEYAFAAYHDENGDGVLNRNAIGLPKEAFAFSNDVRPRLRRPSFQRTKVSVDGAGTILFSLTRVEAD